MTNQTESAQPRNRCAANVKIGNASECLKNISEAIAKRAYEIYLLRGGAPGSDREDWQRAEKEIVRPLSCCGILDSEDEAVISFMDSALGGKNLEEIEICVQPHRVILAGKEKASPRQASRAAIFRVLPLEDEFDPSSAKLSLKQHGSIVEIEIHKLRKERAAGRRAS